MPGLLSALNLFLMASVTLIIVANPQHKVESKTTLSKLQYINAIRDILEGLIKSLATRQKVEYKKRIDLHEYRSHHRNRLGQDVLVCKLCREIFTDPHKYFDHAHFHVVEKLQLSMTTSGNFPCQLCGRNGTGFVNQFELYKHCYHDHLAGNWDKLTTRPQSTTTMKPNCADSLYCKLCNITLPYAEKFYIHSYQHLQENMVLIMNQTRATERAEVTQTSDNAVIDNVERESGSENMKQAEDIRKKSAEIMHPRNASKTYGHSELSRPGEVVTNRDSSEHNQRFKRHLQPDSNILNNVNTSLEDENKREDVPDSNNKTSLHVDSQGTGMDRWTNLYSTASRIIEKFFGTQTRIVRITKDLRTTRKVTLKPYAGEEEFTGDDFAGESGEVRYERILKKMRKNKVYVKCPYCPLRFYYNPEMMNHIRVRHNLSDHFQNQTTFEVPFQTHAPNETKYKDFDGDEFIENFPTYDYDAFSTTKKTTAPSESTTFNLKAFSEVMAKVLKPDYVKGFLTTAKSTRNIDYLHRDRTYATTMAHLHQMEAQLRNVRNYLRQMASTLLQNGDYTYDETTESIATDPPKVDSTDAAVKSGDKGVLIEELTTARGVKQQELVQEGLKEVDQQLQNVQEMKKQYIAETNSMKDGIDATQATRFTQKSGGIREIFRSDRMRTWERTTVKQTGKPIRGSQEDSVVGSVEVLRRYKKMRTKQTSTRKTRPTGNVDYTKLGPTEMSYEDSQETKQLITTLSPEQIEQIRAEQYAKYYKPALTAGAEGPTTPLTDYAKFLQHLAELKRAERLKKEQEAADYEEKLKREETDIDEANTPLMINVNDMFKYRGEDEERNKRVADAFKFIVKNDVREAIWNGTKDAAQTTLPGMTYDDEYGELDYETITQYQYDPTDKGVFYMETPRTSKFLTHHTHTGLKVRTTMSILYTWPLPGYTGETIPYYPKPTTEKTTSRKPWPRMQPIF